MAFENRVNEIYGNGELDKIYKGIGNNIKLDILFYPSVNEYNGNTNLQVTIQNYRINK